MKSPFDISLFAAPASADTAGLDPWSPAAAERQTAGSLRLRQPPEVARVLQRLLMAIPHVAPTPAALIN